MRTLESGEMIESMGTALGQIITAVSVYIPLSANMVSQGKSKEYFGALFATNLIDYLVHAYKRSKELERFKEK